VSFLRSSKEKKTIFFIEEINKKYFGKGLSRLCKYEKVTNSHKAQKKLVSPPKETSLCKTFN
jgi:hypothetical protein